MAACSISLSLTVLEGCPEKLGISSLLERFVATLPGSFYISPAAAYMSRCEASGAWLLSSKASGFGFNNCIESIYILRTAM